MTALIPVYQSTIGIQTIQTVNACDLHEFLAVKTRFDKWIERRIETYGFQEDRDFTTVNFDQGPVRTTEYHLSLDMAKELSMVERTAKGKEARQYFIECERQVLTSSPMPLKTPTHAEAAVAIANAVLAIEQRQDALEARQDAQDTKLAAFVERQPPADRLTVQQFLRQYSKPYLPREVLDTFRIACRHAEAPIMFRQEGYDYAVPYYTLATLLMVYEESTRQLSFLIPRQERLRRA